MMKYQVYNKIARIIINGAIPVTGNVKFTIHQCIHKLSKIMTEMCVKNINKPYVHGLLIYMNINA